MSTRKVIAIALVMAFVAGVVWIGFDTEAGEHELRVAPMALDVSDDASADAGPIEGTPASAGRRPAALRETVSFPPEIPDHARLPEALTSRERERVRAESEVLVEGAAQQYVDEAPELAGSRELHDRFWLAKLRLECAITVNALDAVRRGEFFVVPQRDARGLKRRVGARGQLLGTVPFEADDGQIMIACWWADPARDDQVRTAWQLYTSRLAEWLSTPPTRVRHR